MHQQLISAYDLEDLLVEVPSEALWIDIVQAILADLFQLLSAEVCLHDLLDLPPHLELFLFVEIFVIEDLFILIPEMLDLIDLIGEDECTQVEDSQELRVAHILKVGT